MTKKVLNRSLVSFVLLVGGLFCVAPAFASAAVIRSQPLYDTYSADNGASALYWQKLGTGITGNIEVVTAALTANTSGGSGTPITLSIYFFADSSYTLVSGNRCDLSYTPQGTTVEGFVLFSSPNPVVSGACSFDATKYYAIALPGTAAATSTRVWGSQYQYTADPMTIGAFPTGGTTDANVLSMFYVIDSNPLANPVPVLSPIGGYPTLGIATSSVNSFCQTNFSTSTTGFVDSIMSAVSVGVCSSFAFLFVPTADSLAGFQALASTSQSKIPFSYYFQLAGVYDSMTASSTENLSAFSIDFPAFGSSTPLGTIIPTHVDILSTTTIDKYYPSAIRHTFLFLGASAIWVGLGFVLYRRIVPHKVI